MADSNKKAKKKNKVDPKKRVKRIALVVAVLLVLGGGAAWGLNHWYTDYGELVPNRNDYLDRYQASSNYRPNPEDPDAALSGDRINILIVGSDANEVIKDDVGRADAIMVATIQLETKEAGLLSIPRDTLVKIPGYGEDKINHAFAYGGIELIQDTVSDFLGIPIDYYAYTTFEGFESIVDDLGGVEIDVDKRMHYRTYYDTIDIQKGLQLLDGKQALQYVRFRHDPMGDVTRVERHRKFILAILQKITAPESLLKLPQVLPKLLATMETNLNIAQIIRLTRLLKDLDLADDAKSFTVPGDFETIKDVSYWIPSKNKVQEIVREMFFDLPEDDEIDE